MPSTRSASTSTPRPCRCLLGCPELQDPLQRASSRIGTRTVRSNPARVSRLSPAWDPRHSSSAQASCGSPTATTLSTRRASTRRHIRWFARSSRVQAGDVRTVIGNSQALRSVKASDYVDERFGLPTVTDIISELEKPGRDPRPEFKTATFAAGIEKVAHLKPGMTLEGVVTNVAAFGAFVDIGVHQDGLVHVSAMSHNFVKDPREVVKSGDVVKVKVLEVDAGTPTHRADAASRRRGGSAPQVRRPARWATSASGPAAGPASGAGSATRKWRTPGRTRAATGQPRACCRVDGRRSAQGGLRQVNPSAGFSKSVSSQSSRLAV